MRQEKIREKIQEKIGGYALILDEERFWHSGQ
jgi:hypothetical protein